jgi:hypothetical protein
MRPLSATEVCLFMHDPFSKRLAFIFLFVLIASLEISCLLLFFFIISALPKLSMERTQAHLWNNLSPAFDATWPGLHSFEQRSCQSNLKR